MLKALYDYGQRMQLSLPAGYADKTIKAFLCLTRDGRFTGLLLDGIHLFRCPDIGSLANGTDKSNLLVEKRSVLFPEEVTAKSSFFLEGLRDFGQQEPLAAACYKALEDPNCRAVMIEALDRDKVKDSDRISFFIEDTYLVECLTVQIWWEEYRKQFQKPQKKEEMSLCLITGQPTVPMATVPKTAGLSVVGGHASGDALICFDKAAFSSYGLKKSANAPVSEEAFSQVKVALDALLKDAPILAGMKFVHWYDKPLATEEDPILPIISGIGSEEDEEEEEPEDNYEQESSIKRQQADQLVQSVITGESVVDLPSRYYILLVSGAGGRVLVRQFSQGSYDELTANLNHWNEALRLTNSRGTGLLKPCKLTARLLHLLKHQKSDKDVFKRLGKELSGLSTTVISAILTGGRLPDSIAVRSLAYIRSQMLSEESDGVAVPDARACQWLKAWLMYQHKEETLMPEYNPEHPSTAYQLGAMVAVYAALQETAYPEANVSVVQRFFASAQQTPAFVLGRLAKLSTHHLAKIEAPPIRSYYKRKLEEISTRIRDSIPSVLNLPEQSLFTLGYYQMSAAMQRERREYWAKKQSKKQENEEDV